MANLPAEVVERAREVADSLEAKEEFKDKKKPAVTQPVQLAVSYTHLDVYKRQVMGPGSNTDRNGYPPFKALAGIATVGCGRNREETGVGPGTGRELFLAQGCEGSVKQCI